MIMDHEVKFNEGENSLRKKKHFSTNKENTLGLRSLTMVAIDPSSSLLLFFFFVKTAYTYALKFVRMPNLNLIG